MEYFVSRFQLGKIQKLSAVSLQLINHQSSVKLQYSCHMLAEFAINGIEWHQAASAK
jgi:hypothetical protein